MKKILLILFGLILLMQVIRIDKTNPVSSPSEDLFAKNPTKPEVQNLIKIACYDCHSNETTYPWYTNVAPISFWIKRHINNARGSLNFSIWASYDSDQKTSHAEESAVKTEKGFMPISTYKLMHSEARLTEAEQTEIAAYFRSIK